MRRGGLRVGTVARCVSRRCPGRSASRRVTRALLVTIATWTRVLPWQQVARWCGCAWGTVEHAVETAVAYGVAHRDLTAVTHIGIDEISRKQGHVYVTNVYDLARKRLRWSGEGRSQATLEAFFDFLGPARTAALEGICCAMWPPYMAVIQRRAAHAVLVFDKFHIVSHRMQAVDQVRRDEGPREGRGARGAAAQDAVHLAQEPLESHRDAAPALGRAGAPQPEDHPRVLVEGTLRAISGATAAPGGPRGT